MNSLKIIGHRGAKGLAPENTVASILKAIKYGVDAIEFDIRTTKDSVIVLCHDPKLVDRAGNRLSIADHDFATLQAHGPDLATLKSVAAAVDRRIPLVIELKPGTDTKPLIKLLRGLLKQGWRPDDLTLTSRCYRDLSTMHLALPTLPILVINGTVGLRGVWWANRMGTKQLSISHLWLWPDVITGLSRRGWQLYAFTVNDPAKARRLAEYGIVGIFTDYPDRFKP